VNTTAAPGTGVIGGRRVFDDRGDGTGGTLEAERMSARDGPTVHDQEVDEAFIIPTEAFRSAPQRSVTRILVPAWAHDH
jgi:hypothetical protein